jgi:hypothetical protein
MMGMGEANRYTRIVENIFFKSYRKGLNEVLFERDDIIQAAGALGIRLPKNLGDVIYSFRYRASLPESIVKEAPSGKEWIIRPRGRAKYAFVAALLTTIIPSPSLAETKVPDATPGMIVKYALDDEQGLLARLRYNRLIDIFTGITCYSLQNHLRTTVPRIGQVETDELYVGLDRKGIHYIIPVQAKAGKDRLSIVQIEQDEAMCRDKFPALICRPIAAQFMADEAIALFEFEWSKDQLAISVEKHYRLVPPDLMTLEDLANYRSRLG